MFGNFTFESTEQLVADVQSWLDDPATNYGLELIGDESANQTAKRLYSREFGKSEERPMLTVVYTGGTFPGDLNGDGVVDPADLAIVLGNWGPCPDPPKKCDADLTGDGEVGPADLAIVIANWS